MCCCCFLTDDSDDEKEVSRKRTVRQAASKAVSKQREILLGDEGSEEEEHEGQEEAYMDRMYFSHFTATQIETWLQLLATENLCCSHFRSWPRRTLSGTFDTLVSLLMIGLKNKSNGRILAVKRWTLTLSGQYDVI